MIKLFSVLCVGCIMSGCSIKNSWVSERPSNIMYKEAGYGYNTRYYTQENTKSIEQVMKYDVERDGLKERSYIQNLKKRLAYSKMIGSERQRAIVRSYFENHKQLILYKRPKSSIKTRNADKKDYFSLNDYNPTIPAENQERVLKLSFMKKLPMTQDFVHYVDYLHKTDPLGEKAFTYVQAQHVYKQNLGGSVGNSTVTINESGVRATTLHHQFLDALYEDGNS